MWMGMVLCPLWGVHPMLNLLESLLFWTHIRPSTHTHTYTYSALSRHALSLLHYSLSCIAFFFSSSRGLCSREREKERIQWDMPMGGEHAMCVEVIVSFKINFFIIIILLLLFTHQIHRSIPVREQKREKLRHQNSLTPSSVGPWCTPFVFLFLNWKYKGQCCNPILTRTRHVSRINQHRLHRHHHCTHIGEQTPTKK